MTLAASAMSVGAFGQVNGYFRVVNLGYLFNSQGKQGVVNVSDVTTALPDVNPEDAYFMPGTVMYINATPMSDNPETTAKYVDVTDKDLIVENLRSQAVDASAAIWGELGANMKDGFANAIDGLNGQEWGGALTEDEQKAIVDEMFYYMQMFLQPYEGAVTTPDGSEIEIDSDIYYLKSTTPNVDVLVNALAEKGIEGWDINKLWPTLWDYTKRYFEDNHMDQAKEQWVYFKDRNRIHLGHTYYLIGGRVDTDLKTYQKHDAGATPFISLANNNQYYNAPLRPEIEVADLYSIWAVVPVEADEEGNFFAVKNGVQGLDKHYYTTGYFDFPVEYNTEDVAVYGINEVFAPKTWGSTVPADQLVAYVLPTEYGGKAPAKTPVVIENKKKGAEYAILQPVDEPADYGDASVMKGVFFDATFDQTSAEGGDADQFQYFEFPTDKIRFHNDKRDERIIKEDVMISRENVRVFNKTEEPIHQNNPLGFFKYKGSAKTIKANKGWIDMTDIIPTGNENEGEAEANANVVIVDAATFAALTDGITEVNNAEKSSNVVYDIQGRIVTNPTKGLYIVNGKKVIK